MKPYRWRNKEQDQKRRCVKDKTGEGGFVLVLALLVMMVLTLLGTLSMQVANTEVMTAGNREASLASFYLLEAVGLTGVVQLEQQNRGGEDCADAQPQECLVKDLYQVENTSLDWLADAYSGDVSKPVFDLSVLDPAMGEDDLVYPRLRKFPENWFGSGQQVSRLPESLRSGDGGGLEPPGYVDLEDGGDDLIRYAVQDYGRIGAYSIGSDDPVVRLYKVYGLYHVNGSTGYPGKFGLEMGYRMELAPMEIL